MSFADRFIDDATKQRPLPSTPRQQVRHLMARRT
jgi:hypothetical protein